MKCVEYEDAKATHEDPRSPALCDGVCLCWPCRASALVDCIDRAEQEIALCRAELTAATATPKPATPDDD